MSNKLLDQIAERMAALEAENQRLRVALGWYADVDSYEDDECTLRAPDPRWVPVLDDRGQRAREALGEQ